MSDLYIRRTQNPDPRRQLLGRVIGVFITLAVVLGLVFGIRLGCSRMASEPEAESITPEGPAEEPKRMSNLVPEGARPDREGAPAPARATPPAGTTTNAVDKPGEVTKPVADPPPGPPGEDPGTGARLLAEATQARAQGKLLEARSLALRALKESSRPEAVAQAETLLGVLGIELVLSPHSMPQKVEYTVEPGDSLAKLARKHGTTVELLQKSNMVQGSMIRVEDRLRIFSGTFSLRVSKSNNDLVVYLDDQFFKRYQVGTGQYNRTPVGDFTVNDRIPQPTWWRPDGKAIPYGHPDNELGTHWLSLNIKGYGLHGTWKPDTIGKQASAGCIRLVNEDIEELYTLLPIGTQVTIED